MKAVLIFTGCMITAFAGPLYAQPSSPLADFFYKSGAASAEFTQKDRQGTSSGKITLGHGGRVRWEQRRPYTMLIVSDGQHAWQVDYDLKQATRLDPAASNGWSSFFNPKANEKTHTVAKLGDVFFFTPINPRQYTPARLKTDAEGHPIWLAIEGNERVEITFSNWTRSAPRRSEFEYRPDSGMDVVGDAP